jgi:DNA-binding transcriptional LysR family regulator
MQDAVTLDQLRALKVVADVGSFSAAARQLHRVQSAVSSAMSNLESQLGVPIWDRSGKLPKLTEQGRAVLTGAQRVLAEVDALRRLTTGMVQGLEAQVSLCVDALFPVAALVELCAGFAKQFPNVDLRVDTEAMSAVSARVLDGRATLGVVSPLGLVPGLERQTLASIALCTVVARGHALAKHKGVIANDKLADFVQIVLAERSDAGVPDQAVLSARTWRIADLHTKHALLRAGLGFGNLPRHLAQDDLRAGRLVQIRPAAFGVHGQALALSAVYRSDRSFGPAHRWLLASLPELCARAAQSGKPRAHKARRR